jgi:integrative and conjugative element protein (TIGR02256 family)
VSRADVHIGENLVRAMEREAERHYPNETGGVLLGYADPEDEAHIRVTAQIGPGPKAKHEPFRFEPDAGWQERRIAELYEESGRVITYLGDWHSHPRGDRVPSSIDRYTAREIARCAAARLPHPLIMILHGKPETWRHVAYRRRRWKLSEANIWRESD